MRNHNHSLERGDRQAGREKGAALLLALLTTTVLTAIGLGLVLSSSTESLIHGNFRQTNLAFYAARAGLEESRGRLWGGAADAVRIAQPANVSSGIYIRLNGSINPADPGCNYLGESCFDPSPPGAATYITTAQSGTQVPYVWVKITLATQRKLNRNLLVPGNLSSLNDTTQISWTGQNLYLDPIQAGNPVFILTALAIEPGKATRTIRELASYGQFPDLPAALTLDGPNPTFDGGTSANFQISGLDQGTAQSNVAAIGVIQDSDIAPVQAGAPRPANYPGSGSTVPPPADVQNVSAGLDPLYQTCGGLNSLVELITEVADHVYTGVTSVLPDPGTPGSPVINVVNGDLTISGSFSGTGILLVTGALEVDGDPSYNGIIYVVGTGSMHVSGGGSGAFGGGILIANTTTCPASLGSPSYEITGGGNSGIRFNTDLTRLLRGQLPLELLSLNY